ncbi:sugar phosphate isomerase/epimerase family protein [Chloroflexota bacterium]
MPVYVSTTCLAKASNIFHVLEAYAKAGLKYVELGASHEYIDDSLLAEFKKYRFSFMVHHYFPPPQRPFILNLASQNATILAQSKKQIKKSIDFCHSLGITLFTFHAGFQADPDSKFRFSQSKVIVPYEVAFNTFVESARELNEYAQDKGVKIAVENNVLSEYNVVNGENPFLLLCQAEEFEKLWERIPSTNVGAVLDLGHLKVTSHWLGFDKHEFVDKIKSRVFSIHVHENNGLVDEHRNLDEQSWCLEVINRREFAGVPVTLESMNLSIEEINRSRNLVERYLAS